MFGLYLGKFTTKEAAVEYVNGLVKRYAFQKEIGKPVTTTFLCKEAAENDRVKITPNKLKMVLKDEGITLTNQLHRDYKKREPMKDMLLRLPVDLFNQLSKYNNKTALVRTAIRLMFNNNIPDAVLTRFGKTAVLFMQSSKGAVSAMPMRPLPREYDALIKAMVAEANQNKTGLTGVIDYAKRSKIPYWGGE